MSVIDTHCHLDLIAERGLAATEVLRKAAQEGVYALVQIATDLKSSQKNQELSKENRKGTMPHIYWTAGLHPGSADELESLNEIFKLIQKNHREPDFIGIGETGLDYFHTNEAKKIEKQKESFASHLEWARKFKLPIILHTRDDRVYNPNKKAAIADSLAMVKESGAKGVLHCFSYTDAEALPFVEQGWFVSYSGVLTFPNAKAVQEGMLKLPLDCLLVETDAPFLAPVPYRGQINQPAHVQHTLHFLAELRAKHCGEDPQHVKQSIFTNAKRFINWKNNL